MNDSFTDKVSSLRTRFADCSDTQSKYLRIIALGKEAPSLPEGEKRECNRVQGCQSRMYLSARCIDGVMYFQAESDALISNGLAVCLLSVYDGETPETILKVAPDYLEELGISSSISPNRANGLFSLHLKMKQEALAALIPTMG